MCGIAAAFGTDGNELGEQVQALLARIKHRGNSQCEMAQGTGWAMGTNRLEILDWENGEQPIFSDDRRIAAVLNGEIYNYKWLRTILEAEGRRFHTDTDTEVVATGYAHWGDDLFGRLDGMFALIVYDRDNRTFRVARDPMGIKPLYWFQMDGGKTLFASEIKALVPFHSEVQEVPPGHYLTSSARPVRYDSRKIVRVSTELEANAAALRSLVEDAVCKRVQTDLPVAVFLSGGIDSAAVLYEAIKHHQDITAFTVGKAGASDVAAARALCNTLDVRFVHVNVTDEELLNLIPETVKTIESFEPNHIRGGTLSYVLSREVARQGFRIALCGEGADELFGGYAEFGLAVRNGKNGGELEALFSRFTGEIHKTQLQRVDRTAMRFTLEVRVPYLDQTILNLAAALPTNHKISLTESGNLTDKRVLREAYRGVLPDWIVNRKKTVLSLGAGFGSNGPEGPFFEHGRRCVDDQQLMLLRERHPDYGLSSPEEAYYFTLFIKYFGNLALAKNRPLVNTSPIVGAEL